MKVLEASTSISFKNILFLTDFKETSRAAFTYAMAFARQFNAHIYPAHAVVPYLPTELEVPTMPDILKQIEVQAGEQLARMVKDSGPEYTALKSLVAREGLHTVCEEAGCPNIFECWEDREATFLIA